MLIVSVSTVSVAQTSKSEARCIYVIKNLGLNKAQAAKFQPVFLAYWKELKEAKSTYDNLKEKLKPAIKGHRISEAQATNLISARWDSDAKELAVKKKYTPIFRSVLSARLTYEAFSLANDSKSKMAGKQKNDDE